MELLYRRGIRRKHIPVGSSQYYGVVERHVAMTLKLAMAFSKDPLHRFGDTRLPSTGLLWTKACKYACDVLNKTTRVRDKPDMHSCTRRTGRCTDDRRLRGCPLFGSPDSTTNKGR